jgi:hypothetical protein
MLLSEHPIGYRVASVFKALWLIKDLAVKPDGAIRSMPPVRATSHVGQSTRSESDSPNAALTDVATNRSRLIRGVLLGTAFVLPFWLGVIAILYFW